MLKIGISVILKTFFPAYGIPHARPREIARRNGELFPFPAVFNFTGQPSISLPLCRSSTGLPVGMMFTARYADEATLFRLAAQLEKECPWKDLRPGVWN